MAATTAPLVWDFYRAVDGAAGLGTVAEYDDESSQSIYLASGLQTRVAQISAGHWSDAEPGDEIEITPDDFDATAWDYPIVGQLFGTAILGDELWFFRYLYAHELTQILRSGSVKLRRDSQIAQLDLRVANAGEGLFDGDASLFEPGAKLTAAVTMGDSAQYPLIEAYLDEFDYDRHAADVSLSGRNNIARLSDQTFDNDTSFTGTGAEVVAWILGLAGITKYHIGPSTGSTDWSFDPDKKLIDGLKDVFEFYAGWTMIELPDGTVCVGYPWWLADYQVNSVYQFDGNTEVTKRKTKKSMDAAYSSVRVTGKAADGSELTPVLLTVNNFGHWNLGSHRTKHVKAADGLTQAELQAYAAQLAAELQYIGVGETFDGPLRPYLLPGDVASVTYDGGVSADLGLITSITHSFGTSGFMTSFAVDSGGVATAQTRSGEAYTTRSASVNGYNRQQDLADLIGTIRGKDGKDGAKGEQGDPGDPGTPGAAAGFGTVSATVDASTGTPSVDVTTSGPDTAKNFAFAFHNLKGAQGETGPAGQDGQDGQNGQDGATIWTADANPTTPNYTFNISDLQAQTGRTPQVGDLVVRSYYRYTITSVETTTVLTGTRTSIRGAAGAAGPNSVSSTTATTLNGILKGNGNTVEAATAGTDYQAAITAQGVLVGAGAGSVSAKTLDTSGLTNDSDHIPTSGAVKGAITRVIPGSYVILSGRQAVITVSAYTCAWRAFGVLTANDRIDLLYSYGRMYSGITGANITAVKSDDDLTVTIKNTHSSARFYLGVMFFPSADTQTISVTVEAIPT